MLNRNQSPKWQQELRAFLGIKSGIILEGNVHDEYPRFLYGPDGEEFLDIDNLDQTILSLVDPSSSTLYFFDPVDGFYCCGDALETQRIALAPLFEGYSTRETTKNHGCTVCLMPSGKKDSSRGQADTEQYVWVSEIARRAVADRPPNGARNTVLVLNFASRLDACNLRQAEANAMFLNLMAATTSGQNAQLTGSSLVLVVDKYNDIPAWVYLNNPNIRTISIGTPDRHIRRLYLENLYDDLAPYQRLSREDDDAGKEFVAETEGLQLQELGQILRLACRKGIQPDEISLAFRLYKYGVLDNPWENLENDILVHIEAKLEERVKGQDEALRKVKAVITRAVKGLSGLQHSGASHKPKGILFFAGPTGVGKTETAKALAESIFGALLA